jgi:cytochrome c556
MLSSPNSVSRSTLGGPALVAVVVAAFAIAALGADQPQAPNPAEQQIKYRKALFNVMAGNFGPINAMVSGKAPYDAAALAKRADRVAFVAGILPEAFPAGSGTGAPTRALPEIWQNRAEFDKLMQALGDKSAALATTAKSNDLKQIQPAFSALGDACKACHDKFREKDKG